MPAHGLLDEFSRIKQMLRPEMLRGPSAALPELNPEEVGVIPEAAVPNDADELSVAVTHGDSRFSKHRILHLEADALQRDIFQIRHSPLLTSGLIFPSHFHEFRAQQPGIGSPLLHTCLIGSE